MDEDPPEAPEIDDDTVRGLVDWLEATARWLSEEHVVAQTYGHEISGESLENLRLYEDAALLFRETYDLP
ncbi:hypothetical protein FE697_006030 [Mumia zhuanghuii]|uniref:Uncharacterized protein n=2 Tax=Mumia TaxID=1546255 RepID=A0ABW1QIN5_9ACTN|nr:MULTISPECIES: hypothetical protein [Mumia]KAA1425407.1 hypothetical protein FE697_006030 [Mumia zhuanghuii]